MGTELVVVQPGKYAVAAAPDSAEMVSMAFEQGATALTFDKVGVPAGGMQTWVVPTLEGDKPQQVLEGIIAHVQTRQKAWWAQPIGKGGSGGSPPACVSTDGFNGVGNNTVEQIAEAKGVHECATCVWNEFGSSRKEDSEGKDCKDFARLFLFREGSFMPLVVVVPATSLKNLTKYVMRLMDVKLPSYAAVTKLKLSKTKSNSGFEYSKIEFEFGGALPAEEAARMREVSTALKQSLATHTINVEARDLTGVDG